MIQCISPLRISFMGGRTDFPAFYKEEEGFVVATTIDKYIHVQLSDIEKGISLQQAESEEVEDREALQNSLVKEILRSVNIQDGLEIRVTSDAPIGTGLGSSSSFSVALLRALYKKIHQREIENEWVAEKACEIEIEKLDINTGKQDQYAAAFGGMNAFRFLSNGKVEVLPIATNELKTFESSILLFYTGVARVGSKILEVERGSVESSRLALRGMRNLAKDFYYELTNGADLRCLGEILDEGWHLKKGINDLISNPAIEDYYQMALRAGAYGGKLLGAGGGGYLLFICPKEKQQNLQNALRNLKPMSIQFSSEGAKII